MDEAALFIVVYTFSDRNFLHQPYTQFMPVFACDILHVGAPGLDLLLLAPGAGAILGGLTLASVTRFPRPHQLLLFLAGALLVHHTVRCLEKFSALASLPFLRGWISDHLPFFHRDPFVSLHGRAQPGTHHVSLWADQSRSRPYGKLSLWPSRDLDRRSISSGICGFLTISLAAMSFIGIRA